MQLPERGDLFDERYELQDVLGSGGMSTVYRALDRATARTCAVKILTPERGGYPPTTKARFTREARIIANLRSPATVTMYDFGTSATGLLYIVFEHVPGEDLSALIENSGALDPATTTKILVQLLESLREAHTAGLLHRDLKPENIRVFDDPDTGLTVKLLDFGIARAFDQSGPAITRSGEIIGTPRYMSPEQLTNRALTPASDIYSLGIVAFEMLMGRDALQGNRWADQLDRLATGHVFSTPALERMGPLAAVVARMSARDLADRYASAEAVLAELRDLPPPEAWASVPGVEPGPARRRLTTRQRVTGTLREIPRPLVAVIALALAAVIGVQIAKIVSRGTQPPVVRANLVTGASLVREVALPQSVPPPELSPPDVGALAVADSESDGCGADPPFRGRGVLSELMDLTSRKWRAHIPKNYAPERRHPLVVLFHQDAQGPVDILDETKLDRIADERGFVIIAPSAGRLAGWPVAKVREAVQDLESTMRQLCIDPGRVFAVGHGPGGLAAMSLRCLYPDLAALATTSFRLLDGGAMCEPFAPIPYLHLAPLHDGNSPIEGGAGCSVVPKISLAAHDETFRQLNSCSSTPTRTAHGTSTCLEWRCDQRFVSCHLDGGRGWPGAKTRALGEIGTVFARLKDGDAQDCDGEPADFPMGETIWQFFDTAGAKQR